MSCRGPWEVQAPQHIPEALPFHFLGGHCPGHVTQDSSPLAVIPETLPQLLSLLTAAWGLRQIRENVYEALQKPETWAQAHLPPTPCTPLTKPRADSYQFWLRSLAGFRTIPHQAQSLCFRGGLLGLPALRGCTSPSRLYCPSPLCCGLSPAGLQRWSQHIASYFLPFPGHPGAFLSPAD